jgi:DNA-binding beta-propeller fold protein YncE
MPAGPPSGRHRRLGGLRGHQEGASSIAITPDGKTAYVTGFYLGTATPVTTSTNTAEKPVRVGAGPTALVIAR